MGVSHITPDGSGGYWGWDDQANDWVPVDPKAQEGSFVGNVGRAAERGFSDIRLGIEQATGAATPEQIEQRRQASQAQGAAAAAGAPMAEMLGGTAPDALAGIVAGAATGGAGLPAVLAASALSGAGTAAIRPGSVEERLHAALWGAISGVGGEALGQAAVKGVGLALQLGKGIVQRGTESTARAVEAGAQRATARQAMETAMPDGTRVPGPGGAVAEAPGGPGGSTAGAAQVTNAETEALAREGGIIDQSQGYLDRGVGDTKARRVYAGAEEHGYQPPGFEGAPRGSKAALNAALEEFNPLASSYEESRRIGNAALLNRSFAKAAGLTMDINDQAFNQIDLGDLAKAAEYFSQGFEEVQAEMAPIPMRAVQKRLSDLEARSQMVPASRGEAVLQDTIKNINEGLVKNPNLTMQPKDFIQDLRMLQAQALQAAKDGDQGTAERLNQAVNLYYDTAERVTKQTPSRRGGYRDETIVGKGWKELRDEYRVYMMGLSNGAWGKDGTINAKTILNRMMSQPVNGGWGTKGPPKTSNARPLWDIAQAAAHEQTVLGRTPSTGVRLSRDIGKIARNTALTGIGAGVGVTAINKLWD